MATPETARIASQATPVLVRSSPGDEAELFDADRFGALAVGVGRAAARFTHRNVMRDRGRLQSVIVEEALSLLPAATCAGLTVSGRGERITSRAPSGSRAERLDQAQTVLGEGPAVDVVAAASATPVDPAGSSRDAGGGAATVWVVDMSDPAEAARWPRFIAEALRNRVASMLSVRLPGDHGREVFALNLYADRPRVFDPATRSVAVVYAAQAAVALRGVDQAAALEEALTRRDLIGQAKGMLMQRHRITGDDAFAMLVDTSQRTNLKLHDVAARLVHQDPTTVHESG